MGWARRACTRCAGVSQGRASRDGQSRRPAWHLWILDNGPKWKDLSRRFGSKSSVHRWFTVWGREGVFENIMRDAGKLVEELGGYQYDPNRSRRARRSNRFLAASTPPRQYFRSNAVG
ncbi:MAG: hypothetical protein AMXMBFR58_11410 [Phycisphaerae bacterium]